jgi:hypothetical protein
MTYNEVTQAIDSGKKVYWHHEGYEVIKDSNPNCPYGVICRGNNNYVGLKSHFVYSDNDSAFFVGE